ncbi:MAG: N-acyl homoserine lactonase family protein [Anaerolineae bacterium]|nr:N-acyl homoserine lactonase family protein [Anaerolineae bacterium]
MNIKIHPIQTGLVKIKRSQVNRAANNLPQPLNLFFQTGWSDWLPILAWIIEHPEGLFVVDTGETARVLEPGYFPRRHPYYRWAVQFDIQPADEIGPQMRRLGMLPGDVTAVILTHLHTDHAGGLYHFPHHRILIHPQEWQAAAGRAGTLNGYVRHNWPMGLKPEFVRYVPEAVGPFAGSMAVTGDGRIRLIPTPGHTPHHLSVLVQTETTTCFLAGDASYTEALMQAGQPDGVSVPAAAQTLQHIRQLGEDTAVTYLPAHDPESIARLHRAQGQVVAG